MRVYVVANNTTSDEEAMALALRFGGEPTFEEAMEQARLIADIYAKASDDVRKKFLPIRVVAVDISAHVAEWVTIEETVS